jgi:cell wall-associated NlpC family hydrolase
VIRDLIGIPFLRGGRDREGADCLGLLHLVLEERGIPFRDPWVELSAAFHAGTLRAVDAVPERWPPVALDALQPGDVVLVENGRGGHVLIVAENGYCLQAAERATSHLIQTRRVLQRFKVLGAWRPA